MFYSNHISHDSLNSQPRYVIVDEVSETLEPTLLPIIVITHVEHLVLLGNTEASSRPCISCNGFKGDPRYMDTSLFEKKRDIVIKVFVGRTVIKCMNVESIGVKKW